MSVFPALPSSVPHWGDTGGNVVEPPESKKSLGWAHSEAPSSGFLNWVHNILSRWVGALVPRTWAAYVGDGHDGDCPITGTVSWYDNQTTVTGTGTNFQAWMVGCTIHLGAPRKAGIIAAVVSPTQITLAAAPGGTAWWGGQGYGIVCVRDQDFATIEIDAGNALKTNGWRVRAALSCRLAGTISCNGGDGSDASSATGSTGGAGGVSPHGSLLGGSDGMPGAYASGVGMNYTSPIPGPSANVVTGLGGKGGDFSATGGFATGSVGTVNGSVHNIVPLTTGHILHAGALIGVGGGSGGLGGHVSIYQVYPTDGPAITTSYTLRGGGGGAGGGTCLIACGAMTAVTTLQTGSLSCDGTSNTINGTGTNFLSRLCPGSVISIGGAAYRVVKIIDGTTLDVHKAPPAAFTNQAWSIVGAVTAVGGNGGDGSYGRGNNGSGSTWTTYCYGGHGGGGGDVIATYGSVTGTVTYLTDGGLGGVSYDPAVTGPFYASSGAAGTRSITEVVL